jgi:dethiobiotin synthetase
VLDVFVTGTDTGVGKTWAAAALAAAAVRDGLVPGYLKPAQTGEDDDAGEVARRVPGAVCRTLVRFRPALAPGIAARVEGSPPVALEAVVEAAGALARQTDGVIVEGAGGLLVPLAPGATMADLAAALGLPLVIVTRVTLGTLNHTALTLEAARARGLAVAGLVLNGCTPEPDVVERTNREELARLAPVIASLPLAEPAPS